MAHISLDPNLPGMRSLLAFRPAIAPSLLGLMQTIMRSNIGLSIGERELIATYVSKLNNCSQCFQIHGEVAKCFFIDQPTLINEILEDSNLSTITERQNVILNIAKNVQRGGLFVTAKQIEEAKLKGISELEIHDIVLIASLFCFFNKYSDGLGLTSNDTPETLSKRGQIMAEFGYHID